jgi:membrane protein
MFSAAWKMLKDTVLAFINDEALSREAEIAFYTVTSIAPVLLIVIAVAGLAFGRDAAQNALTAQLSGLMGQQTAEVLQTAVASASSKSSGVGDDDWNYHLDGDGFGRLRRNSERSS